MILTFLTLESWAYVIGHVSKPSSLGIVDINNINFQMKVYMLVPNLLQLLGQRGEHTHTQNARAR